MYWLSPSPPAIEETFATWQNAFSDSELAQVIKLGEDRRKQDGIIGANGITDANVRLSTVSWLEQSDSTIWLYDKLGYIVRQVNGQFFDFDIAGMAEQFQYTVYENNGSHYTWHMDKGVMNGNPPRKLSISVQLSDPDEYEGGDLEFMPGASILKAPRDKGIVVAFPSWVLHRVTPVTRGCRRSLVVWVCGPKWC